MTPSVLYVLALEARVNEYTRPSDFPTPSPRAVTLIHIGCYETRSMFACIIKSRTTLRSTCCDKCRRGIPTMCKDGVGCRHARDTHVARRARPTACCCVYYPYTDKNTRRLLMLHVSTRGSGVVGVCQLERHPQSQNQHQRQSAPAPRISTSL